MTGKKVDKIVREIFRYQKEAAEMLNMSGTKVSQIIAGKQNLSVEAIKILLTKYNIDPYWLFSDDQDDSVIKYNVNKPGAPDNESLYQKHIEALEKITVLMEEKAEYLGAKATKKNHSDVSNEP